jgi:hypothetical protein
MGCVERGLVSADALFALATGQDDESAALHVATCADCAAAVAGYAMADRELRSRLARVDCPDALALGELALGLLDPSHALLVHAHLADCPHCAGEVKLLTAELGGDPLRELVAGPGLLRRIMARLVPVQAQGMAPAGVRGDLDAGLRTYEAEDITVSLTDQPVGHGAERTFTVLGLVDIAGVAPDDGAEVRVSSASGQAGTASLDSYGNFSIAGLQPGDYGLELRFPDRLVAIESVEIGNIPA